MNMLHDYGVRLAGPLGEASVERLACLVRHWTWADEARSRFERELAGGVEYDEDLAANHPFGSYYHWCALLAGFSEAAMAHALLPFETAQGDMHPWPNSLST